MTNSTNKPISVRQTSPDKGKFPDLGNIKSIILREGARIRKEATWMEILDRHTGDVHHYTLGLRTTRKLKAGEKTDPIHSFTLEHSDEKNEVQDLIDFIKSTSSTNFVSESGDYLVVKAPQTTDEKSKLIEHIQTLTDSEKLIAFSRILDLSGRNSDFLEALVERVSKDPRLFLEAAAAINLAKYRLEIKKLEVLIRDPNTKESSFQALLSENPWMFGSEYSELLKKRKLTRDEQLDFLLRRTTDGYIEIIEIKTPMTGANLFAFDNSHKNYYPSSDLSKAISQTQKYIELLDSDRDRILANDQEDTRKVRAKIIIGRDVNQDQVSALRRINGHLYRIEIITFDQLLKIANNVLSYLENAIDVPLT